MKTRRSLLALLLLPCPLLAGCCPSPAPRGSESPLERESRLWLDQGTRNPGPGNASVTVDRIFYDASQAAGVEILWRYVGRRVDIGNWGRAGEAREGFSAQVNALERSGRTRGRDSLFVTAVLASPGASEIFLGEEQSFVPFVFQGRLVGAGWERRRVGASLAVRVTPAADGLVSVELTPRFSRIHGNAADDRISLEEARTTVLARPDSPLVLGGLDSSSNSLDGHLFGVASKEGVRSTLMVLTVRMGR